MTKCPQCGKDLHSDDVLIPIKDPSGNIVDCFHVNKVVWGEFSKECQSLGVSPYEMMFSLMDGFLKQNEQKRLK